MGLLTAPGWQVLAEEAVAPRVTIRQVMESVIVPATNTLWGAEDPLTDADWKLLEDAAVSVITAGVAINMGGSGSRDDDWAQQPVWRRLSRTMTDAAVDSLAAIHKKDIEALLEAGYVLYPPCEECHKQFNPGVVNQ